MTTSKVLLVLVAVCGMLACDPDDDQDFGYVIDSGPSSGDGGMVVDLNAGGRPQIGQPLRVWVSYWPTYDWVPDTLVTYASIEYLGPPFELVSGDSAWVDTLVARQPKVRSLWIRPLQEGERLFCLSVRAPIDTAYVIGALDCLYIVTPRDGLPRGSSIVSGENQLPGTGGPGEITWPWQDFHRHR